MSASAQIAWSDGEDVRPLVSKDASLHERTVQAVAVNDVEAFEEERRVRGRGRRPRARLADVTRFDPMLVAEVQSQVRRIGGDWRRARWIRPPEGGHPDDVRAIIR